jgi:hypothetical protein
MTRAQAWTLCKGFGEFLALVGGMLLIFLGIPLVLGQ